MAITEVKLNVFIGIIIKLVPNGFWKSQPWTWSEADNWIQTPWNFRASSNLDSVPDFIWTFLLTWGSPSLWSNPSLILLICIQRVLSSMCGWIFNFIWELMGGVYRIQWGIQYFLTLKIQIYVCSFRDGNLAAICWSTVLKLNPCRAPLKPQCLNSEAQRFSYMGLIQDWGLNYREHSTANTNGGISSLSF